MLILIVVLVLLITLTIPSDTLGLHKTSIQETKSRKSINIQLGLLGVFLIVYVCNVLYNWNYFKEYGGPHDTGYFIAKYIEYGLRFLICCSILILIISVIFKKRRLG